MMRYWMKTLLILDILLLLIQLAPVDAKRKIRVAWNPQCPSEIDCGHYGLENFTSSANSLLHFTVNSNEDASASASNQSVHILFSNIGGPAILMLLTDGDTRMKIDWTRYLNESDRSRSLTVHGNIDHSMAVMFSRIWRFNDAKDTCNVDSPSPPDTIDSIPLENLLFHNVSVTNGTVTAILGTSGDGDDNFMLGQNGTLRLTMEVFDAAGRSHLLPRLPHTDIGYQLDIELINIDTRNYSQARFAIETVAVSKSAISMENNEYSLTVDENINDEFTPGVFQTYYLTMPDDDGFLMWKPVAYRSSSRSLDSFTRAKHGDAHLLPNISSLSSLNMNNVITAYYGSKFRSHAIAFNITMGMEKDKFYNNYRYLVWSLGVGWGSKPPESLSTLVIALIIICAAFPALVLFLGVPYLIIRRKRASLPYQDLIEDA